jgi:two-component system, sensor histidine kinase LadS
MKKEGWKRIATGLPLLGVFLWGLVVVASSFLPYTLEDHIVERAYLLDPEGQYSLEKIHHDAFEFSPLTDGFFAGGFGESAHWFRIVVRPSQSEHPLVLRIRPNFLDEIRLFEVAPGAAPSNWKTQITGDRTPWRKRTYPGLTLGFFLPSPQEPTQYYLRLQTTSSALMDVTVVPLDHAINADIQLGLFYLFYLIFMGWVLFWAFQNWALLKDPLFGTFIPAHGGYLLFGLSHMGYLYPLFPDASLDLITSWALCISVLAWILFHRQVALIFRAFQITRRFINLLIPISFFVLILLGAGQVSLAMTLNSLLILLMVLVFGAMTLNGFYRPFPSGYLIAVLYFILALAIGVSLLPLLGLIRGGLWYLNAPFVYGLCSATLMVFVLNQRLRRQLEKAEQDRVQLQLTAKDLEMERKRRTEQSQFMAMLTHELNTPLTSIRLSLDAMQIEQEDRKRRKRIDRSIRDMTAILQRCRQLEQFEHGESHIHIGPFEPAPWLEEVIASCRDPDRVLCHYDSRLPHLHSDAQLLGVALTNLIDNAIKYGADDAPVCISMEVIPARNGQKGVQISVSNQPGPVGQPDPQKVFEKYYRGAAAHSKSGSGLGLYLVRVIMDRLKGHVQDDFTPQQTCFSLWVPIDDDTCHTPIGHFGGRGQ